MCDNMSDSPAEGQAEIYKMFDPLGVGLFILNEAFYTVFVNKTIKVILDKENEEIMNRPLSELFHYTVPDDKVTFNNKLRDKNNIIDYELCIFNSSGIKKYILINVWKNNSRLTGTIKDITSTKLFEIKLQTENNIFESFMDLVPGSIYFKDLQSRFTHVNKAKAEKHGCEKSELIGKSDFDFYPHEVALIKYNDEQNIIENKSVINKDEIIETAKGKYFIRTLKAPYFDENRNVIGTFGISWDITDLKNSEKQLKDNSERLEMALLGSGSGLWDWNIQTGEEYYSERWATMLGYELHEIAPNVSSWLELVHPDDKWHIDLVLEKHLKGETAFYIDEYRLKAKDGSWRWVLDTGKVVERDANNNPLRAVGTHIDITAQKEYETQLERNLLQQELLSDIAIGLNSTDDFDIKINSVLKIIGEHTDVSRVAICENDADGKTTSVNYEWCNINIPSVKEQMQAIPYDIAPLWKDIISRVGIVFSRELIKMPDGIKAIIELSGALSFIAYPINVSGKFSGFISFTECKLNREWTKSNLGLLRTIAGIISNTFERRLINYNLEKAIEKAQDANKTKSQFLANMSHELRTPMNGIMGVTGMLLKYNTQNLTEFQLEGLKAIQQSGNRLLDLINDLLDISKIEAGKMTVTLAPFSLDVLFYNLRIMVANLIKSRELNFVIRKSAHVPDRIISDEKRIHQILLNLIGNSVKFTDKGAITLRIHTINEKLCFEVTDEGIGISKENLPTLFEEFRQLDNSITRKYQGTGLGLAICKKLVKLLNGEIEIESELNVGTTVRFHVPYRPEKEQNKSEVPNPRQKNLSVNKTAKKSILIIEDEKLALQLFKEFLSRAGFRAITAETGKSGYKAILSNTPDIIILDLDLPDMSGIDILKKLRNATKYKKVPIIITSINDNDIPHEYINEYTCFLRKPVTENILNHHVDKLLRLKSKIHYQVLLLDPNKELLELEKALSEANIPLLMVHDISFFLQEIEYNKPSVIILSKMSNDNVNISDISRYIRKSQTNEIRDCYLVIYTDKDYYNNVSDHVNNERFLFYDKNQKGDLYVLINKIQKLINH